MDQIINTAKLDYSGHFSEYLYGACERYSCRNDGTLMY